MLSSFSEAVTPQKDISMYTKVFKPGELSVTAAYISSIKSKNKCYWETGNYQQVVILPTLTIVYTCLDVSLSIEVVDIPRIFYIKKKSKKINTKTSSIYQ